MPLKPLWMEGATLAGRVGVTADGVEQPQQVGRERQQERPLHAGQHSDQSSLL